MLVFAEAMLRRGFHSEEWSVGIASELRQGMDNMADATRTLAGAICELAASRHSKDYGDQRNMSAVFYTEAERGFAELQRRMSDKDRDALHAFIAGMCKGNK